MAETPLQLVGTGRASTLAWTWRARSGETECVSNGCLLLKEQHVLAGETLTNAQQGQRDCCSNEMHSQRLTRVSSDMVN
jgi:hypothetical protein